HWREMFETLVSGVLTNVLGSYIDPKCFSSNKINVEVWSGYVVLRSLELKPEVVQHPALQLVRGVCGSIELKIPWNRLHSDSVVITIDDVYLLLRTEDDVERVLMEQDEFSIKKALLEQLYAQAKKQREEEEKQSSSSSSNNSADNNGFTARLVNKIIDNLELHIRRIHVRLEDQSSGDHPFALGLTIESVHAQSTNSNWQPSYVDTSKSNEPRIYKIIELNHLSVYLNPHCEVLRAQPLDFETCSLDEFMNAFNHSIPKRFDDRHYQQHTQMYPSHQQHHFVLKPIDASARLIVNRDPFETSVPKFELDVSIDEVALRLEESQYCDVLYLAATFQIPEHIKKYQRYRKFRPRTAIADSNKGEWWRYAINAIMHDVRTKRMRWSWSYMKERRTDRKRYVALWHRRKELQDLGHQNQYLLSDSEMEEEDDEGAEEGDKSAHEEDVLSDGDDRGSARSSSSKGSGTDELAGLEEIERRRPVEDILFFRYIADLKYEGRADKHSSNRRYVAMPPLSANSVISDTESVDTDATESSVPVELRYRSWGNWMFGWTSKLGATGSPESGEASKRVIPEVELRELYKILEYEPARKSKRKGQQQKAREGDHQDSFGVDRDLSGEHIVSRVTFALEKGSITLSSDPETNKKLQRDDPNYHKRYSPTEFLLGTFSNLQLAAATKGDSTKVDVSLQSIEAYDESAESSAFSRLLSRKQDALAVATGGDGKSNARITGAVFLMSYETNPSHISADAALLVHLEPLEVVLSPTARCWGRLASFMNTPQVLGLWAELEVASFNDIVNLKARTEAKLQYVMANRIALSMDLRVQAPVIIIPESDTDYNCSRLVVDLGHLNFRTDRLSKLDEETSVMSNTSNTVSGSSSMVMLRHNTSPDLGSSTSFVKQLYDEAEKGEGAIRWKEEFYDKFSLTVSNVHVLLIPYGRKHNPRAMPLAQDHPSVSLPPHLRDIYEQEKDLELVKRFNINVIVRTSVLPLDATLTRLYVHADLPALTFNLSLDKYHQLILLANRFTLTSPEAPKETHDVALFTGSEDFVAFSPTAMDTDSQYLATRRKSFLSTSVLDTFKLDATQSSTTEDEPSTARDESDGESSADSDDTWFSIASGNFDSELQGRESLGDPFNRESIFSLASVESVPAPADTSAQTDKKRARKRRYAAAKPAELLDRKLFVCTLTFPLISIHLKKPRTAVAPMSASYRYEEADLDEDSTDNGTILVKLEGFRLRLAKRTLSTQANICLRSLEVEDYLDTSGRATEYLIFSCPSITVPYAVRAPIRRGTKYGASVRGRRRASRQRERVISFQRSGSIESARGGQRHESAPENLVELVFASSNDKKTGYEVARDMDIGFGCIQVNVDQSYVCSLLELLDDTTSKMAQLPAPDYDLQLERNLSEPHGSTSPPPLELTPSMSPDYFPSINLTDSVRADLERARKSFLERSRSAEISEGQQDVSNPKPIVAMSVHVRLHSLSACFGDRGEMLASVAVLHTDLLLAHNQDNKISVHGSVADIKVFDLSPDIERDPNAEFPLRAKSRSMDVTHNHREVLGLDLARVQDDADLPTSFIVADCTLDNLANDSNTSVRKDPAEKSQISVSVQPIRLFVHADFIERIARYVLAGPLAVYTLQKDGNGPNRFSDLSGNERSDSFSLEPFARRRPWTTPDDEQSTPRKDSSTPFFDAIDPISHTDKAIEGIRELPATSRSPLRQSGGGETTTDRPSTPSGPSLMDICHFQFKIIRPTIIMAVESAPDGEKIGKNGLMLDLGVITLKTEITGVDPDARCWKVDLFVDDLNIASIKDKSHMLEKTHLHLAATVPIAEHLKADSNNGDDDGSILSNQDADHDRIDLTLSVSSICLNVSESYVCLLLELLDETVAPISRTFKDLNQFMSQRKNEHMADSARVLLDRLDSECTSVDMPQQSSAREVCASLFADEVKVQFWSKTDNHVMFESALRSCFDGDDNNNTTNQGFDGLFGGGGLSSPRKRHQSHSLHSVDEAYVRRGYAPVGDVAVKNIRAQYLSRPSIECVQLDASVQELVFRDRVVDENEALTHVIGPVPNRKAHQTSSNDTGWQRFSLPVTGGLSPPSVPARPMDVDFSMSMTAADHVLQHSASLRSLSSEADVPQLSVQLRKNLEDMTSNDDQILAYTCEVSMTSLQVLFLPRAVLRMEHFALSVFLAAQKKIHQLRQVQSALKLQNSSSVGNPAHLDAANEFSEIRDEGHMYRSGVHRNSKRDSLTESLKDEGNTKRAEFAAPPPSGFLLDIPSLAKEASNDTTISHEYATQQVPNAVAPKQRWTIQAELSNLQLWLLTSDKKKDMTGLLLSTKIKAGLCHSTAELQEDDNPFMTAFGEIHDVELGINMPLEGDSSAVDGKAARGLHHPWALVEPFDIDVSVSANLKKSKPQVAESEERENSVSLAMTTFKTAVSSQQDVWAHGSATVKIDSIFSRVSYRELPLLLKIGQDISKTGTIDSQVRQVFQRQLLSAVDDAEWKFTNSNRSETSMFPDIDEDSLEVVRSETDVDDDGSVTSPWLAELSVHLNGLQFRLINNIVGEESPVVGIRVSALDVHGCATSQATWNLECNLSMEAWYHNLRLVASEPLIEPWNARCVMAKTSQVLPRENTETEDGDVKRDLVSVQVHSDEYLQVNITDAFIANLAAANRAWQWVVNEGGDPREMTEYSTYWIRNNTGLKLRYWGPACRMSYLNPDCEEPLEFLDNAAVHALVRRSRSYSQVQKGSQLQDRQLFISVEEEELVLSPTTNVRKWQSEGAIPVDQVDSRLYGLVDFDADLTATRMRKCECVIDVLVERGCKVFVVRSTVLLENNTASDLELEFQLPQKRTGSPPSRSIGLPGHVIPAWKTTMKASSVVPIPLHLVAAGEGHLLVRPPDIKFTDTSLSVLPKSYAKERVKLALFDRTANATDGRPRSLSDDGSQLECTIKFHRLYSDRPVRPFTMTATLTSASSALYCRKLAFYAPLIVHNLTAGNLEYCIATPNDWAPKNEIEGAGGSSGTSRGWEDSQQRLRERGTINVADSLVWHLSDMDTPLELRVRMKGFEWSEPFKLCDDMADISRIRMNDIVGDSRLYISAETKVGEGGCREIFLFVPYWIVNLTGLKLEYEFDEERMGNEHLVTILAGQQRLDREQLVLQEESQRRHSVHDVNAHVVHPLFRRSQSAKQDNPEGDFALSGSGESDLNSTSSRPREKHRRHPCLLPSVPPIKGFLDVLPKAIDDPKTLGQVDVLHACYSSHRFERGCVRLRVKSESELSTVDSGRDAGHSKWSEAFVLDQTGTTGEIETEDFTNNRIFTVGYSISNAKGNYSRTKVIMLTPRFVVVNALGSAIEICHSSAKLGVPSTNTTEPAAAAMVMGMDNAGVVPAVNHVVSLDPGAYADFHWTLRFSKSRTIRCRFSDYGWSWSGAVPLSESGEFAVRMRHEATRESKLVRVTLKMDSSCICVYFREESTNAPPYRIENYSLETLRIHQHTVRLSEILLPHHSLEYAWDEPTQERMLVVDMLPSAAGDNSRPLRIGVFSLDKIQHYPDAVNGTLGIEVSTDGPTRVLRFTDTRLRSRKDVSHAKPKSEEEVKRADAKQSLQRFVSAPTFHLLLQLKGLGISVVDALPKELIYLSMSDLLVEIMQSEENRDKLGYSADREAAVSRLERENCARTIACRLQIGDLQIDNQLQLTPFPVLLRFSQRNARSVNVAGELINIPVVHLCVVKHDEYAGINFIRHFSARVLPMHVRVDGSLLSQLAPLLVHGNEYGGGPRDKAIGSSRGQRSDVTDTKNHRLIEFNASLAVGIKVLEAMHDGTATSASPSHVSNDRSTSSRSHNRPRRPSGVIGPRYPTLNQGRIVTKDEEKKLYFEEFYIDMIRATVSFSFGASAGAMVDGHYASVVNSYTYTLSGTSRETSSITVGPLRLILNAIGTSLTKIANAPFKLKSLEISHSFVQPDALAARLLSHYQSEALRQAYVILGSVDVLGNPMIAWKNMKAGFQDFIYEPAHGIKQQSPKEFAIGIGRGTASLARASVYTILDFNTRILTAFSLGLSEACLKLDEYTGYPATRNIYQGLAQGVSGIVVSPIHSFEMNGVRGIAPGVLAGVLGLFLKPLLGFSLATSTTAATLRDAIDPNTKALLLRARPPRFVDLRTRRLKVYSYLESLGEEIVGKLRGGIYRGDGYLGHIDLKQKCLLVTRKRILYVDVKANQKYDIEWELLADEVVMVQCKGNGENILTFYYMEEEFKSSRRRTPAFDRGLHISKHELPFPEVKALYLRATIQQQERALLTKMNAAGFVTDLRAPTPSATPSKQAALSAAMGGAGGDFAAWQPRVGWQYPIFRIGPLQPSRSMKDLHAAASNAATALSVKVMSESSSDEDKPSFLAEKL
ncbi:TPA: hypothetical protein N0F65_006985, partial [Lagenidium giganteum]